MSDFDIDTDLRFNKVFPACFDFNRDLQLQSHHWMMILRLWTLLKVTTSVIFVADALEDGSKSPRSEPVDSWGQKINIVETLISQGLAKTIKQSA